MQPSPSQFSVEVNWNERTYTDDGFNIQSGPSPSAQPSWGAAVVPHYTKLAITLPLESAPASFLNKTDFSSIYYPNWEAVKSQAAPATVSPNPANLPQEGYIVRVSGADERGFSKMLALAQSLRNRFPRLRFTIKPHPQFNYAKMLVRSIGRAVGFNNFQKAKLCGDKVFLFVTCAVTADTAQTLTTIISLYHNISMSVQRENFLPSKQLKTVIIHRTARIGG
jgi:hypothetical protein